MPSAAGFDHKVAASSEVNENQTKVAGSVPQQFWSKADPTSGTQISVHSLEIVSIKKRMSHHFVYRSCWAILSGDRISTYLYRQHFVKKKQQAQWAEQSQFLKLFFWVQSRSQTEQLVTDSYSASVSLSIFVPHFNALFLVHCWLKDRKLKREDATETARPVHSASDGPAVAG